MNQEAVVTVILKSADEDTKFGWKFDGDSSSMVSVVSLNG